MRRLKNFRLRRVKPAQSWLFTLNPKTQNPKPQKHDETRSPGLLHQVYLGPTQRVRLLSAGSAADRDRCKTKGWADFRSSTLKISSIELTGGTILQEYLRVYYWVWGSETFLEALVIIKN